jgi:hypothetical protein
MSTIKFDKLIEGLGRVTVYEYGEGRRFQIVRHVRLLNFRYKRTQYSRYRTTYSYRNTEKSALNCASKILAELEKEMGVQAL